MPTPVHTEYSVAETFEFDGAIALKILLCDLFQLQPWR